MFQSQEWVDLATQMLTEDGTAWAVTRPAVVTRTSAGEVATPKDVGICVGVAARYSTREIDGKNIITGDLKFICDASTWQMKINDRITVAGVIYRCEDPSPVAPDGTPLLYIAQMRRLGHGGE